MATVELIEYTPRPEELITKSARICYQSSSESKLSDDRFILGLIKSGHHSVLEHASASFHICGISRAMTHQLVRHRLCSFSQKSQRYVKESGFEYIIPRSIVEMGDDAVNLFESNMADIQIMYNHWKMMGLRNEDARFVLPNACCSDIIMTANFREWRTIFGLRCDHHAQWEISTIMLVCLEKLTKIAPNVFSDLAEQYLHLSQVD